MIICPLEYIKVGCKVKVEPSYLEYHAPEKDFNKFFKIIRIRFDLGCFYIEDVYAGFCFYRIKEIKGYFSND